MSLTGVLGGWEMLRYLLNRKVNSRKERAEADGIEFQPLRATLEFLQQQLIDKEMRFAEQTKRLREVQDELFAAIRHGNELDLALSMYRCERIRCIKRIPPTLFTPDDAKERGNSMISNNTDGGGSDADQEDSGSLTR